MKIVLKWISGLEGSKRRYCARNGWHYEFRFGILGERPEPMSYGFIGSWFVPRVKYCLTKAGGGKTAIPYEHGSRWLRNGNSVGMQGRPVARWWW